MQGAFMHLVLKPPALLPPQGDAAEQEACPKISRRFSRLSCRDSENLGLGCRLIGQGGKLDRHALAVSVGIVEQTTGGGIGEKVMALVGCCTGR
jgi:hypothetical protein